MRTEGKAPRVLNLGDVSALLHEPADLYQRNSLRYRLNRRLCIPERVQNWCRMEESIHLLSMESVRPIRSLLAQLRRLLTTDDIHAILIQMHS
jgi:hypothetical protein